MGSLVRVLGAGPAGGAAALAALQAGAAVEIFEKSRFPRHKVCGEFLSPGSASVLERLGVLEEVRAKAARLVWMRLSMGGIVREERLPEPGLGISRSLLDEILLARAIQQGAVLHRQMGMADPEGATVDATGRKSKGGAKGKRLFGFKAHFAGAGNDAVELYFLRPRSYVGVSAVEGGRINVCGLAEEQDLAAVDFDIDRYLEQFGEMQKRLAGLRRCWDWMRVGPLEFGQRLSIVLRRSRYYSCGDALSFVDPFTGSGILSALVTGSIAGRCAADQVQERTYLHLCRKSIHPPYVMATVFRHAVAEGWASLFARWVPLEWLFAATRPSVKYC
jgi:flavin-dependent dehydrogenase